MAPRAWLTERQSDQPGIDRKSTSVSGLNPPHRDRPKVATISCGPDGNAVDNRSKTARGTPIAESRWRDLRGCYGSLFG